MQLLIWIEIFGVFFMFWFYKTFKNYLRSALLALSMAGPKPLPILGNVFLITDYKQLQQIANNVTDMYGPMFRTWIMHMPLFWVYEPDHLKVILSGTKVQSDKNYFYSLAETFIGKGLITNNGNAWKKNRKSLQPYFNINILENYLSIFSESAEYVVNNFPQNEYTNIVELINVTQLRSLHKAVLGITLENTNSSPFRSGELIAIKRVVKPWLLADFLFQQSSLSRNEKEQRQSLRDYVVQAIENRRQLRVASDGHFENVCLLDMMLEITENFKGFTEEDIINETITFVLAGQDSVAAALALCFFYLARSPEAQEKAYKEISEVITDEKDFKCIKLESLNAMQYLEQCVKEALRLAPSVPLFFRVLKEETQLGEYTLPAGTDICISPYITHRLSHIFPDPLKFDPERFSPENIKKLHPYGYLPFSLGPRNCIGAKFATLEMKTIVAAVLHKFKLSLKPGTENVMFSYRIALRAKGGIWIKATTRGNNQT